jgi:bifunctional UDP-N-acetylglucosamine pyrophosphorylase/glucosamine-1-phosphate N-acetyltransferase
MAVVPVERPESYGCVKLDGNRIRKIVEKPQGEIFSHMVNAGIYYFSEEIFDELKKLKRSPDRNELELPDAISSLISKNKKVIATVVQKSDWLDVGMPWNVLDASNWMLRRMEQKVEGTIEDGVHIKGKCTVGKNALIRSGAYIEGPVYIGEDSDIGPNCYIRPYTSIGRRVRIGNACDVKNSVIMDGTHIAHLSYVGDSVICENCNFGAKTVTANLRFDGGIINMMIKGQMVSSGRTKLGAIVGANVKTGVGVNFMPGVKVGGCNWIWANSIVSKDMPEGSAQC